MNLPNIGWPDEQGRIRLEDNKLRYNFTRYGRVYIQRDALSACENHGWIKVEDNGGDLIIVERSYR